MKQALIKTVIAFIIFTAVLLSPFLFDKLGSSNTDSKRFVKQTEELLKEEYRTSDIKFYSSFYTDRGYEKYTGAVCGYVIKLDHAEDDNNEYRKYYALVVNDGKNIISVTDVDFDIYVSFDRWNKYCDRQ
ncbi:MULTISPECIES: hypothetical protein [Providencia]|uniref:hypothetical protein n=1 Tax=Providencia TaxID=586 RepID=UPI00029C6738|nr:MULTISPECIES: hypothetical protein [Providencia]EKT66784.1 hypothetical protein OO9_04030 [Providencia alcalifaciens Dmel2]